MYKKYNLHWLTTAILTCVLVTGNALAVDGFEPPQNHFLADSPWPMSHRNAST